MAKQVISRVPPELYGALAALAVAAAWFALLALRARRSRRSAERSALTDPLTGLANRVSLDHRLAVEWAMAERHGRVLGVLFLDLEGFKELNDTRGHAAGDEVLREVGAILRERPRSSDLAARVGGDEFVILAPETSEAGLANLAQSLRAATEHLPVGVSIGWAERSEGDENPAAVVARADIAMYEDKERRVGNRDAPRVTSA